MHCLFKSIGCCVILLQIISEEFIVFSKSSIDDGKLLISRPHGGTVIFIRKSIKCTISNCDIECDRFNAMLVDFYNFTVLITCFYMPCDSNNCDRFSSTVSAFQALKAKHAPSYAVDITKHDPSFVFSHIIILPIMQLLTIY